MMRTFLVTDCLIFEKVKTTELKPGDIIVFKTNNEIKKRNDVVHRIIAIFNDHLITRGDNNSKNDDEPVTVENLIGKVTHYKRNGKIHKVWNGRLGMLRASILYVRLHVIRTVKFFLRKPYRSIKQTGIVAELWRPEIKTIYFETQDGSLVKYVHKGRTVASCWTDTNRWWFRRPYDFIIGPKLK